MFALHMFYGTSQSNEEALCQAGPQSTRVNMDTNAGINLVSKLFDRSSPWVVVPNGSIDGYFDWVPAHLRVGPWHPSAVAMLFIVYAGTIAVGLTYWEEGGWTQTDLESMSYPPVYSAPWWFHTLGCLWMCFIMVHLARSKGLFPWVTYTMQAWMMLTLRHALCAMAPWSTWATGMAERMRFLCAITTTQTFVVWNFVLMPVVYFVLMKGQPKKQKEFVKMVTSFVMMNIHGLNVVLCWCNVGPWGSPRRPLEFADFYVSVVALVVYSVLYLGILDRLGVHLYPIFSPRLQWQPVVWMALLAVYCGFFVLWRWLLRPLE